MAAVEFKTDAEREAYFAKCGAKVENYGDLQKMMADDKAEREAEWEDDMLQYERAGLSEQEQKKIPKLDETNNISYRYLRDNGSSWQYDPHMVHPKLKNRIYRRFDTFDKNSDGVLQLQEVMYWADRMKTLCQSSDEQIASVREALRVFFTHKGATGEGVMRENWVESNRVFAEADRLREKNGERRLVAMLGDAYYDVLDTDGDGLVSLPELKRMMNIFRVPEEAAYTFFEKADKNKNGQLDREEMHELFVKFWMSEEYDPDLDGIFAYKY